MLRTIAIATALLFAPSALAQERIYKDSAFRVTDIQVRFLYEQTGTLSVDLTADPKIALWNSIIGEGDAKENANDLLVTALVVGPGQHNIDTPLIITVRDSKGKLLKTRTIPGMMVETKTYRGFILEEAGCAGVITLTAKLGTSTRTEKLDLACGE